MSNYHNYTCPKCGKELDGMKTDHHEERRECNEVISEWRVLFWCPEGCGVKEMYIEEILYFDFDGEEVQTQEIVYNKFIEPMWKVTENE